MQTSVGTKLICTYLAIIALTAAPAAGICYYLRDLRQSQARLLQGSQPTVAAVRGVREGLHQSAAGIRGTIAVGGEHFRAQREQGQEGMRRNLQSLDNLAAHLSTEERQLIDQVRRELGDIEALHQAMETAPRQTSEQPALQKLAGDSTPLGERLLATVTAIIDAESKLEKTPQRVKLLEEMTGLRANLHGSLVEMHSYLTTAQEQHVTKFSDQWRSLNTGLDALAAKRRMLTPEQNRQLGQVRQLLGQFQPLPDRLFAMRKSEAWNLAQQQVKDEAAPREARAEALLAQVIDRTENRAQQGTQSVQGQSAWLGVFAVGGPGGAALIGIVLGCLASRRVSRRLRQTAKALEAVAAGNRETRLPIETSDEFGRMALAINMMADSSAERSQAAEMPMPQLDAGRLRSFADAEIARRRPHTRPQATPAPVSETQAAQREISRPAAAVDTNLSQTLRSFQTTLSQVLATAGQLASTTRHVTATSQHVAAGEVNTTASPSVADEATSQLAGEVVAEGQLHPELAQQTQNLEQSSERLRSQATQLDALMRRLQEGLAQMPQAETDEIAETNIHGAEHHLSGPKMSVGVAPSVLQTA